MKNHHSFIVLIILLTGCSSYSSLSSFSSRKYTKGYFFNAPAEKPVVAGNGTKIEIKTKAEPQENLQPNPITILTNKVNQASLYNKQVVREKKKEIFLSEFKTVNKVVAVNDSIRDNKQSADKKARSKLLTQAWVSIGIGVLLALLILHLYVIAPVAAPAIYLIYLVLPLFLLGFGLYLLLGKAKQSSQISQLANADDKPKKDSISSKTWIQIYKAVFLLGIILIAIPLLINSGGVLFLVGLLLALAGLIAIVNARQDNHTLEIMAVISGAIAFVLFGVLLNDQGTIKGEWAIDPFYGFGGLAALFFLLAFLIGPGSKQNNKDEKK